MGKGVQYVRRVAMEETMENLTTDQLFKILENACVALLNQTTVIIEVGAMLKGKHGNTCNNVNNVIPFPQRR